MTVLTEVQPASAAQRLDSFEIASMPPQASAALLQCRDLIVKMNLFVEKRDQEYQQAAKQITNEITQLKKARRKLSSKVHTLEAELESSQKANKALQRTLSQQQEEGKKMIAQIRQGAALQEELNTKHSILQREQDCFKAITANQQKQIEKQAKELSLKRLIDKKRQEQADLKQKLQQIEQTIEGESDSLGLKTAGAAGLLGFFTGGIGWALAGVGIGSAVRSWVQSSENCHCTTDLRAEKQSIQDRLHLVTQEIMRLSNQ